MWSHKENVKGDTPHLCFLEPISSLLVKTWTLVEIKTASKCQQSEVQSWFLSPSEGFALLVFRTWRSGRKDKGLPGAIWTLSLSQSWKAAPAAGPSLGGKHVESCSSVSSQDQSFEGLITSSAADASIPARFHRQLQLPQAAHAPPSPAGPEKQNLDRKLGQRWVFASVQANPHSISIWLKTDLERVKHLPILTAAGKRAALQMFTEMERKSKANLLIFWHQALVQILWWTAPGHWLFQTSSSWGEEWRTMWVIKKTLALWKATFGYTLGYILESKRKNN